MNALRELRPVSCRCCGATQAPPGDNEFGLCGTCEVRARLSSVTSGLEHEDVVRYLAKRLLSDMSRLRRLGFARRCEAITSQTHATGYQCGSYAMMKIHDGTYLCSGHLKSKHAGTLRTVGDGAQGDDERFFELMTELCSADRRIRDIVRKVAKAQEPR